MARPLAPRLFRLRQCFGGMQRIVPSRPGLLLLACLVVLVLVPATALARTNPSASGASPPGDQVLTGLDLETGSEVHYLPPTRVRVGPHAVARHGKAGLVVECRVGEPGEVCRGGIGLHALRPIGSGSFYVGRAHFEVPLGEKATVWAPLSEGARAILAKRGVVTASVFSVILVGVSEVKVRIVAASGA
jgi:hypothetical protein